MLNNSKICVIGAHGVGKTTLVETIVLDLAGHKNEGEKEVWYVKELARYIMEILDFDWRVASKTQISFFQEMLLSYYLLSITLPGPLLSDRSPLDTCAYLSLAERRLHRRPLTSSVPEFPPYARVTIEMAMRCYTAVYFYYGSNLSKEQQFIQDWLEQACRILGIRVRPFYRDDFEDVRREIVGRFLT